MIGLDTVLRISDNVVARKIEGEIIIIPLTAGVGNADEELYSLNNCAQVIWDNLDGHRTVDVISRELAKKYGADLTMVQQDVLGFISELESRKIAVLHDSDASSSP